MEASAINSASRTIDLPTAADLVAGTRAPGKRQEPPPRTVLLALRDEAEKAAAQRPKADAVAVQQTEEVAVSAQAHYLFEYEGKRPVMKLQDSKGALIYQVPSKGRLLLLLEEDQAQAGLKETA